MTIAGDDRPAPSFSLIADDALIHLQRSLGLIPPQGLGVGRRALVLALVSWGPIAVWAALAHRVFGGVADEPLLAHFGIHVRCLVAIPLLVIADATVHAASRRFLPYFVTSGLVGEAARPRFEAILRDVQRLSRQWLPWVLMLGLVVGWTLLRPAAADVHEVRWAENAPLDPHFGFGGWWQLNVARPIFVALLLAWIWRLGLLGYLLGRVARLDLSFVPTHPDRAGGLAFLDFVPMAFAPVVLAISAVAASRWAHDVVYHDTALAALKLPAAALLVVVALPILLPFLAFRSALVRTKRRALLDYGALVGEHGRRVRRRWVLGERVADDPLLGAPEIGPVADTIALFDAVKGMRTIPIGVPALAAVLVPAAIPMVVVAALRIPLKDLLGGLVKILL
jgi:hypothetical protein